MAAKVKEMDLASRLAASVKIAAPSIVPDGTKPKPEPKPALVFTEIRELIANPAERLKFLRLSQASSSLAEEEKKIKYARRPITEQLKNLCVKYDIERALCNDVKVSYYDAPRSTISKELLLAQGVAPAVIAACTVVKSALTLRITPVGQDEEESD